MVSGSFTTRPAGAHHSRSPSARLTKIRTPRITMVKRNAASCPFQVRDCHIAQYSPATTRKPKNQTPKPTVRPATAHSLARLKAAAGARSRISSASAPTQRSTAIIKILANRMVSMELSRTGRGQCAGLLDHLVGAVEHGRRDRDAERFRGFQVDHELELARLLDRHVGGLGAAKQHHDLAGEGLPIDLQQARQ